MLRRFDAALFGGPMLLLGADNTAVGLADDHAKAAAAVAAGRAMTWAAQVRPGVVALDLDLDHAGLAALVLDDLTGWCRRRGMWHTSRPSGGGPGRHHLIVVPGPHESDLLAQIAAWRAQLHVTSKALDVRAAIRPLSAPHRSGRPTAPAPVKAGDLTGVTAAVEAAQRRPRMIPAPAPATPLRIVPTAKSGPFRLPAARPAGDGSRSASEFGQTVRLANDGATADEAWGLIGSIKGGKAAARGRAWWERYMWSKVLPPQADSGFNFGALILPIMAAVRPLYSTLETRQRHTLETVLVAILERLQRAQLQPVALSERDLSLATGLSRRTLRAAGERAVLLGVLARSRSARRDAAWVWELGAHAKPASSLTAPSIHTPRPSYWLHSSPAGSATHLLDHHLGTPTPAGSTRQRALQAERLHALQRLGVVGERQPDTTARAAAGDSWREHLAVVTAERDLFYAGLRDARASRQAPYHRRILARRQRQLDWWAHLSHQERDERRTACREHLATLTPHARHQHVTRLRSQRELIHQLTIQYPSEPTLPIPSGLTDVSRVRMW